MTSPFSYLVLRYVHDIQTEEFANVGVVVYCPSRSFLRARCTTKFGRVSEFFAGVDGGLFRATVTRFQSAMNQFAHALFVPLDLVSLPNHAGECAEKVLPRDEAALQLSPVSGGLTDDPAATLERLFERYVAKYAHIPNRQSRSDGEILPILKSHLAQRNLLKDLQRKTIRTPDYEHEFPYAWQNGIWNACEVVSLDLLEKDEIVDKANRWLGRAHTLRNSPEDFRLVLFLGKPKHEELLPYFNRAKNILDTIPEDHLLYAEDEVERLTEQIASDLAEHSEGME